MATHRDVQRYRLNLAFLATFLCVGIMGLGIFQLYLCRDRRCNPYLIDGTIYVGVVCGVAGLWEGVKWAHNTPAGDMERDEVARYYARERDSIVVKSDVEVQFVN